jgi:Tol biopolymer transport system component
MALSQEVSFMKVALQIAGLALLILILFIGCEKSTGPKKDTTPPAAIADLRIVPDTETPVTLAWTAPGDDGNKGAAVLYSIRYSTETALLYEWHFASQVVDEPAPHPAGTAEEFVVTGLSPDSNHYFAIKTQDDAGNWSPLSNIASSVPVAAGGIAFVSDRDDNLEIYVVSSDGSYLKNITRNEADDWDPAWSWDRRIAFVSDRGGGESDIWISSADGRYQGRLTSRKNWQCYRPVFSRNGYTIAFYGRHYRLWNGHRTRRFDIYIVNSDGTNFRNLTENLGLYFSSYVPSWSPDGKEIAFASRFYGCLSSWICLINTDGSRPRGLVYPRDDNFFPIWSPDGTRILYVSD